MPAHHVHRDYIGIAAELRSVLRTYTESKGKGQPTLDATEALVKLKELMEVARHVLHGFDFRAYRTRATALLLPAANFVLGLEDGKRRWADVVLAITKAFSLCGTLDEAVPLREEIAFYQAIKAVIAKATTSEAKLTEESRNAVLKQILDNAVVAEGVEDIFKLAGLERPDIGILSVVGRQRERNKPTGRRGAEEDRHRGHRKAAQQHVGRLAKARKRASAVTKSCAHYPAPSQITTRHAGRSDPAGVGAGGTLVRGVVCRVIVDATQRELR